jgi:glycosyltransferase involved in cell wall biosynthesis
MGKNKKSGKTATLSKGYFPFVSVCTPTFNRRPFIQMMFQCFRNQTYPKDRMEWIIVDDGTDKISDLVYASDIPQIKYISLDKKVSLGEKRNIMHKHIKGSIVVYMDDDDYYPPERVQHAVARLMEVPSALCAGSSEMYIYFKHINKMYQSGPFSPTHATAATFAFRAELLKQTQFENTAALAEEKAFLKNYTIPFVQLDSLKTILVFSHDQNTFDKKRLLNQGSSVVFKESDKTVDMFIRTEKEKPIYDFFMHDIDEILKNYKPGDPSMKPDVLKQIKEIDATREKQRQEASAKNGAPMSIMIQQDGKPPQELNAQQIVEILQNQQKTMESQNQHIKKQEEYIKILQEQLAKAEGYIRYIQSRSDKPLDGTPTPDDSADKPEDSAPKPDDGADKPEDDAPKPENISIELSEPSKSDPQVVIEEPSKTDPQIINDNSNPDTTKEIMETIHITM